jgi:hypothetical protein
MFCRLYFYISNGFQQFLNIFSKILITASAINTLFATLKDLQDKSVDVFPKT